MTTWAWGTCERINLWDWTLPTTVVCRENKTAPSVKEISWMTLRSRKKAIVALQNVSLGWCREKPLVKCESLSIQPGQHVVIRGGVGCGKTLFLHSLLGEVKPIEGTIQVDARLVAYCSQAPWLENLTARQNVFSFSTAADNIWQQRVINACALKEFIDSHQRLFESKTLPTPSVLTTSRKRWTLITTY